MFHAYIILIGAGLPKLASASIFPTQPIQATVWSADQPMLLSWTDDWKYPLLSEMGPVDISLWCNTDTYLASLASGVDPTTKTREVTVPGRALRPGSTYTLRFTTSKPVDTVIYSADFAIIPANGTSEMGNGNAAFATTTGAGTRSNTGDDTATGSGFKTVPTSNGSLSTWTTTTAATSAGRFGSTTPSGVPPPSGTIPGGGASTGQRAASAGRRGVNVEKLKFQFVFMVWPVLMGITMAL